MVLVLFFKSLRFKQQVLFFGGEVIEDSGLSRTLSADRPIFDGLTWEALCRVSMTLAFAMRLTNLQMIGFGATFCCLRIRSDFILISCLASATGIFFLLKLVAPQTTSALRPRLFFWLILQHIFDFVSQNLLCYYWPQIYHLYLPDWLNLQVKL